MNISSKLKSVNNGYVMARGFSTITSLAFALIYSRNLGLERRSVLAFIMAAALISSLALNAGLSITFRKDYPDNRDSLSLTSFFPIGIFVSLLVSIFTIAASLVYGSIHGSIPINLLIMTGLYSFSASFNFFNVDIITATKNFKTLNWLEVQTTTLQIFIYLVLRLLNKNSVIVSVLMAFTLSYTFYFLAALKILRPFFTSLLTLDRHHFIKLIGDSRDNYLYGLGTAFVDRIDRLLIGLILPIEALGRYSVMASLLTISRFVPDAIGRLSLTRKINYFERYSRFSKVIFVPFYLFFVYVIAISSQEFIKLFFGSRWLLSTWVPFLFGTQELLRGTYQIYSIGLMNKGESKTVAKSATFLIVTSVVSLGMMLKLFGIEGAPIALFFSYLAAIIFLRTQNGVRG